MADTKKLYIKTYGCQMNVYDSERMAETLGAEGYVQTDTADDADMILLNTCHIREKAAEKIYSELGKFRGIENRKAEFENWCCRLRGSGGRGGNYSPPADG